LEVVGIFPLILKNIKNRIKGKEKERKVTYLLLTLCLI